jgi:branched-chain amino acid transport system permease protein
MAVVIGGSGTLIGPVIGSIFLVVLSEVFVQILGEAHLIIFGLLLIPVVLYSPSGLVGWMDWLKKVIGGLTRNNER